MPSLVSWIEPSLSQIRASTYPCSESESSSVIDDSAFCLIISSIISFNSFSTLLTSFHQFDYLFVIELNSCWLTHRASLSLNKKTLVTTLDRPLFTYKNAGGWIRTL